MSSVIVPREEQRQAADPSSSVWVSANAGSGKTRVLTDRVIRILLQQPHPQPGRILCLTFTKAAASEMKDRLFERLGKWALMADDDLIDEITALTGQTPSADMCRRARRLFALALETPGGFKVQTIHSFCESVLHKFPMEAGVQPQFQVLDEQAAGALFSTALDDAIDRIRHDEGLRQALAGVAARVGTDGLAKLVQETDKARQAGLLADIAPRLRRIFGLEPQTSLNDLREEFRTGMDKPALHQAAKALAQGTDAERNKKAPALAEFLADDAPSGAIEAYRKLFLIANNERQKFVTTKESRAANADCEAMMREEQERVYNVRQKELCLMLVEDSASLARFSGVVIETYNDAKRHRGFLDYDDLIRKTADLLDQSEMATWVLYKLDGGLDHILVDESQDTSLDQWRVIMALADEFLSGEGRSDQLRTIFAVGDEKQSIYSFQGADPQAVAMARKWFKAKADGAQLQWSEPRLETSFRSSPAVLQYVDEVFSDPAVRAGLQEDNTIAVRHQASRQNHHGRVELWPVEKPDDKPEVDNAWLAPLDLPDEDSGVVKLARKIAGTIGSWLTEKQVLPARNRPISADDVLILVRSRGSLFFTLARELKRRNIPVAGVDRMVLTDEIAVMDLMALARFSLLPDDDLTLATVLKSPLIGLDEEALFTLAYDRQATSLWERLRDSSTNPQFTEAHRLLAEILTLANRVSVYGYFSHILECQRGRAKILARLGPEANDPLDEFLNRALIYETRYSSSLQGFIDWMERGATEVKREQDRAHAGVRLMTVHGAKGLEANIVILPDSCTIPGSRQRPQLVSVEKDEDTTVAWRKSKSSNENPNLVSEAMDADDAKSREEHRRLLYVAMTRARDWLIICGALNQRQKVPETGSWYDLVKPAMERCGTAGENGSVFEIAGSECVAEDAPILPVDAEKLPSCFSSPPRPETHSPRPLTPSALGLDEPGPGPGSGEDRALALVRGKLIHRLLEVLPALPEDDRSAAGRALIEKYGADITPAQREDALTETGHILAHPDFAPVFAANSQAEVSVAGSVEELGPYVIAGQVDRLVVTPSEVLIVDYKTNRQMPGRIADVPQAYLYQLAAYRVAMAEIYPGHTIRCALLWTTAPSLMEIPEDTLIDFQSTLKEQTLT